MARADRPDEGLIDLILEIVSISGPVLNEVQSGIQHRGRVAAVATVQDANGLGQPVCSIEGRLVARGATDGTFHRPARIEEQHLPESLSSRRNWSFGAQCLRQGTEQHLSLLE